MQETFLPSLMQSMFPTAEPAPLDAVKPVRRRSFYSKFYHRGCPLHSSVDFFSSSKDSSTSSSLSPANSPDVFQQQQQPQQHQHSHFTTSKTFSYTPGIQRASIALRRSFGSSSIDHHPSVVYSSSAPLAPPSASSTALTSATVTIRPHQSLRLYPRRHSQTCHLDTYLNVSDAIRTHQLTHPDFILMSALAEQRIPGSNERIFRLLSSSGVQ